MSGLLEAIPRVLSWTDASLFHVELRRQHEALLEERLQEQLEGFAKRGLGEELRGLLDVLTAEGRTRLLTAPEAALRLFYGPADAGFLAKAARAEHYRVAAQSVVEEPVWSALGDHYFPAGPRAAGQPVESYAWDIAREMVAPRLADAVPVDHFSPWAAMPTMGKGKPRLFTAAELEACLAKLRATLQAVAAVSAAAHALFTSYVRALLVWNYDGGAFAQFSTDRFPGRVVFANALLDEIDPARLASAFVHESTHSFVYTIEEKEPLVPDRAGSLSVKVPSPWTGRQLHIHSFVQACFVWFGLWQFWRRAIGKNEFPPPRVAEELEFARRGFHDLRLPDALARTAAHLAPVARDMLEALVRDVGAGVYD